MDGEVEFKYLTPTPLLGEREPEDKGGD